MDSKSLGMLIASKWPVAEMRYDYKMALFKVNLKRDADINKIQARGLLWNGLQFAVEKLKKPQKKFFRISLSNALLLKKDKVRKLILDALEEEEKVLQIQALCNKGTN